MSGVLETPVTPLKCACAVFFSGDVFCRRQQVQIAGRAASRQERKGSSRFAAGDQQTVAAASLGELAWPCSVGAKLPCQAVHRSPSTGAELLAPVLHGKRDPSHSNRNQDEQGSTVRNASSGLAPPEYPGPVPLEHVNGSLLSRGTILPLTQVSRHLLALPSCLLCRQFHQNLSCADVRPALRAVESRSLRNATTVSRVGYLSRCYT